MGVRVHHLNCGTFCPHAARLVNGSGSWLGKGKMVCHCLLIETDQDGLILVDTGFGTADCDDPRRVHFGLRATGAPKLSHQETAINRIKALGFEPKDVRHIIVTHLDLDHAGGLSDFPHAQVHVHEIELHAAMNPQNNLERRRYLPAQWAHEPKWSTYSDYGDDCLGLKAVRTLDNVQSDVALIPLTGHTRGHSGVAINTGNRWLLHAGDAYFFHGQLEAKPSCPAMLRFFQRVVAVNNEERLRNLDRLRELHQTRNDELMVFSAHDPVELDRIIDKGA